MNTNEAKDFLAEQAAQQAALDHTPLSDLERRMMYFTESDPASCGDPFSLNDEFEEKYDTAAYEAKMSRLLHHAYKRLKAENPTGKLQWDEAISTLERATITFCCCGDDIYRQTLGRVIRELRWSSMAVRS